ncbi:glycosyltransferase family 4 protein [bacterium SCSIO 12696]|nr:glycosyltransferase family 4 protein [bacterium SCSIO 12696]
MAEARLKVLLIVEQCNPDWFSAPLVGYRLYESIRQHVDVTLVTHERNREALEKACPDANVFFIKESRLISAYERIVKRISTIRDRIIWPIYNSFGYFIYGDFDNKVYRTFKRDIEKGKYDVVHSLTPVMPRYPVKIAKVCDETPFVIGPVNGGVPFPKGFKKVASQEFAYFNFIRIFGRFLIPGYKRTYKKARYVLSGSSYTKGLVERTFDLNPKKVGLFFENGVTEEFLSQGRKNLSERSFNPERVTLIFVGRLVPYKGADMLLEAVGQLDSAVKEKINLLIVGDGPEMPKLREMVKELGLEEFVELCGWVSQSQTLDYYRRSDIFCFPSVREFGGAVVLEAMANALPCIVVNNGGIGEFVNEKVGFKVEPKSREYVISETAASIEVLVRDAEMRLSMSREAMRYAEDQSWNKKSRFVADVYKSVVTETV